jgi:hypothetical protein
MKLEISSVQCSDACVLETMLMQLRTVKVASLLRPRVTRACSIDSVRF